MTPENLGLDTETVLRRWCELECSAFNQLSCEGHPDPSPQEVAPLSQSLFHSGAPRNAACIAACDAAMPGLLSRSHPISQYFVQNDGHRIGRELRDGGFHSQRCGPPGVPVSVPVTNGVPKLVESSILNRDHPIARYFNHHETLKIPLKRTVRAPNLSQNMEGLGAPGLSPVRRNSLRPPTGESLAVVGMALAIGVAALFLGPEVLALAII